MPSHKGAACRCRNVRQFVGQLAFTVLVIPRQLAIPHQANQNVRMPSWRSGVR